jgi:hypothetical protein
MADQKISLDPAATDLTGAVIPVVQAGLNKKADSSLFATAAALALKLDIAGGSGVGNILFGNNYGIDVVASGGTDTLNIGTSNADVINIGWSGAQVNIIGTLLYENVTNLTVTDKLITLNKGGASSSAVSTGFEIEEGGTITGYFATNGSRNGFDMKAPAIAGVASFSLAGLTASRIFTLPDVAGTLAVMSAVATQGSVIFAGASGVYSQDNANFYWNAGSHILSVNVNADFTGTDAVNIYGQYDAYQPNSAMGAIGTLANAGYTASTSRGTGSAPSVNSASDLAGGFSMWGYTGSIPAYKAVAGAYGVMTGVSSDLGGEYQIWTKADNGSFTQRFTLDNAGGATVNNGYFNVNGTGTNPTMKIVGAGSTTNYTMRVFQNNGTTEILSLLDNGMFSLSGSGTNTNPTLKILSGSFTGYAGLFMSANGVSQWYNSSDAANISLGGGAITMGTTVYLTATFNGTMYGANFIGPQVLNGNSLILSGRPNSPASGNDVHSVSIQGTANNQTTGITRFLAIDTIINLNVNATAAVVYGIDYNPTLTNITGLASHIGLVIRPTAAVNGFGTGASIPLATVHVVGKLLVGSSISSSGALVEFTSSTLNQGLLIPRAVTTNIASPVNGMIALDPLSGEFRGYKNGSWQNFVTSPIDDNPDTILRRLIVDLASQGWNFSDPTLVDELNTALNSIKF